MLQALPDAAAARTARGAAGGCTGLSLAGVRDTINDRNETNAIKRVFGEHAKNLAISSTRSMHGHPLGAALVVGPLHRADYRV